MEHDVFCLFLPFSQIFSCKLCHEGQTHVKCLSFVHHNKDWFGSVESGATKWEDTLWFLLVFLLVSSQYTWFWNKQDTTRTWELALQPQLRARSLQTRKDFDQKIRTHSQLEGIVGSSLTPRFCHLAQQKPRGVELLDTWGLKEKYFRSRGIDGFQGLIIWGDGSHVPAVKFAQGTWNEVNNPKKQSSVRSSTSRSIDDPKSLKLSNFLLNEEDPCAISRP